MTRLTPKTPELPRATQERHELATLDAEALLYVEATYRIRLTRSGAVCHAVTGHRLVKKRGEHVAIGSTEIREVGVGVYELTNGSEVHAVAFFEERWHGGSVEHAGESAGSSGPA